MDRFSQKSGYFWSNFEKNNIEIGIQMGFYPKKLLFGWFEIKKFSSIPPIYELELELIQYQMTQKPMLWCEGEGAPVRAANKPRSQEKKGGVCVVSHCL